MSKYITATYYKDDLSLAVGLTPPPTIKIWDLEDNSLVVDSDPMEEIGQGKYKYLFDNVAGHSYTTQCDTGIVSGLTLRYADGTISSSDTGTGTASEENQEIIIAHLTDIKGPTWTDQSLETIETAIENIQWGGYGR